MSNTTHPLLQPRIMVKVGHPHSPLCKGEILTFNEREGEYFDKTMVHSVTTCEAEEYADVFRVMPWWEDRDVKDMPEYVKDNAIGKIVVKVHKWVITEGRFISEANKDNGYLSDPNYFAPATLSDYLTFKSQQHETK